MYKRELEKSVRRMSDRVETNDSGTVTYYNNNNELLAISTSESFIIAANVEDDEKMVMLVSFKDDDSVMISKMERNRLWYVPSQDDLKFVKSIKMTGVHSKENFPACYLIYNFGVLESLNFKDCSMSKTKMDVYLQSCDGNCYSAIYIAGEGSIAGNGNYYGNVVGGFQFATIGTCEKNGGEIIIPI